MIFSGLTPSASKAIYRFANCQVLPLPADARIITLSIDVTSNIQLVVELSDNEKKSLP